MDEEEEVIDETTEETTDTESTEDTSDTSTTVEVPESLSSLYNMVLAQLGDTLKSGDEQLLMDLLEMVYTEACYTSNRFMEEEPSVTDLGAIIVQATIIAYENRGVEGETKNSELSQTNYFVDWHQYLQTEIVNHRKEVCDLMRLTRFEDIVLYKVTKETLADGSHADVPDEGTTYKAFIQYVDDDVSAAIYGADMDRVHRVATLRNELEDFLLPKVRNKKDNVSNYYIEYNSNKYSIVKVTPRWLEMKWK